MLTELKNKNLSKVLDITTYTKHLIRNLEKFDNDTVRGFTP